MVGKLTRNDHLSASELPVLMGVSKFKTVNQLLKEKIDYITGIEPEFITNEAMFWGNLQEDTILIESAKRLAPELTPKIEHKFAYIHKKLPFGCSLDGSLDGTGEEIYTDVKEGIYCVNSDKIKLQGFGILEAKLTAHEPETPSELPLYRGILQLQMQMDTTGAKWGCLCVYYQGTELRLFLYERDEELIAEMHKAIIDFQRRLDKWKTQDEIEWYEMSSTQESSVIFDSPEKTTISLPTLEDSANYIYQLRKEIKQKEEAIERTSTEMMDEMRDNEKAIMGNFLVEWKTINYKATAERIVPAKPARSIRQSKLKIKYMGDK